MSTDSATTRPLPDLFQYWDGGDPPAEVAGWMRAMREGNPGFRYRSFDETSAAAWIASRCGTREAAAFAACAVPAMQADYLRLCLLHRAGGLYVDADFELLRGLDAMCGEVGDTLVVTVREVVGNDFLLFRTPRHLFVDAALALATEAIERRRYTSPLMATGPGLLTALRYAATPEARGPLDFLIACSDWAADEWADLLARAHRLAAERPEFVPATRAIEIRSLEWRWQWVGVPAAAYKAGERHWPHWRGAMYR